MTYFYRSGGLSLDCSALVPQHASRMLQSKGVFVRSHTIEIGLQDKAGKACPIRGALLRVQIADRHAPNISPCNSPHVLVVFGPPSSFSHERTKLRL